jgi:hypothetical protein
MALVAHAYEKHFSSPSLTVEAQGQESQNGRLLLKAEMNHVCPAVRRRNRQIFVVGYRINRVGLRPLLAGNAGSNPARWRGYLPLLIVVFCQVEGCAMGRWHVQRFRVRVMECDQVQQ